MKPNRLSFPNSEGIMLSAQIEWPANQQPHSYAIFAHCFTCGKNLNTVRVISKTLANRGFAVLSFDFTGLGQSEGEFSDSNFSGNVQDLISAANFLKKDFQAPSLLVGHSLGGAAVIQAAASISSVHAVATIGAPAQASHVKKLFKQELSEIESKGIHEVDLGGRLFQIKKQFVDDLENQQVIQTLSNLRKAILILHSPQDAIVSIDNAADLYLSAKHPKSFVSLDGADHLLSQKNDAHYSGEVIATWAQRYLQADEEPSLETEHQTVALIGDQESGFTTLVKAGKHFLTADEPDEAGGSDLGPSPYQLLSSALAACTVMTLRMYANRKGMTIQNLKVHVNHSKRHADDYENTSAGARIDHFERIVEADGELTENDMTKLLEIANKCPVHKTLEGKIKIETTLK